MQFNYHSHWSRTDSRCSQWVSSCKARATWWDAHGEKSSVCSSVRVFKSHSGNTSPYQSTNSQDKLKQPSSPTTWVNRWTFNHLPPNQLQATWPSTWEAIVINYLTTFWTSISALGTFNSFWAVTCKPYLLPVSCLLVEMSPTCVCSVRKAISYRQATAWLNSSVPQSKLPS